MGRIRRGWRLTGQSWRVLRSDGSLAVFPVLGGLTALFLAAAIGVPSALLFGAGDTVPGVVLAALGLYAVTFAGVFFNVALAGAAARALDGEGATVRDGVAVARGNIGAVAGWAGLAASVNVVIRGLQERLGPVGAILLGGVAMAWGLVTFLAVPVIAIEGTGPIATLKRSASIFRERWGEQVTGQASIGGVVFLIAALPAAALAAAAGLAAGSTAVMTVLIAAAVTVMVVAAVVGTALSQIFAVALYRFAVGRGAGAFSEADLSGAVAPRRARRGVA